MKRFLALIQSRFLSRSPFFLVFYVTSRCNARCAFCFNWDNVSEWQARSADELSLEEIDKITSNIRGVFQLTLAGGEPFMRRELPEIVNLFHRKSGVQTVTIPSNGTMPDRIAKLTEMIVSENPGLHLRIGLSTPDIGDGLEDIYKVKNAFAKHQETYRRLRDLAHQYANLTVSSGVTLSKYNADKARDILAYIHDHMPESKPQLALVRGNPQKEEALDIASAQVRDVYDFYDSKFYEQDNRPFAGLINSLGREVNEVTVAINQGKKPAFSCRSGEKLVVIYDNGDVYPCEYLQNAKMGNIREFGYDLRKLLNTQTSRSIVRNIVDTHCSCTWECANYNNILFSPSYAAKVVLRYMWGLIRKGRALKA